MDFGVDVKKQNFRNYKKKKLDPHLLGEGTG
jgi:hypothetical protein